jgi:internalin A
MTLNSWDFGGQQIYHATHQFFLTNRSLFLLVWNARTGYEQGRLRYWLETITALAPESPILLVATHTDQREADVPLAEFRKLYPRLAGQVEISNSAATGLDELRHRVAQLATTLPLMGEEWPTHWLAAADALRAMPDKYVKPEALAVVLDQHHVSGVDAVVLTRWLHDLGDLLHYPEDPELDDIVILQPQWVAEHIGRVLVHPPVIDNAGIFRYDDMDLVWADLDDAMRQHFLRLMERFDLSYRTVEDREVSLVVERLPLEVPDYRQSWSDALASDRSREISMIFRLSAVPAGIPTWFIARQHRFTTHTHWRSGALLADASGQHKALISADAHERTAELHVRGVHPHDFFSLVRDGFELTLARFPGLDVLRLVPCPGHDGSGCDHMFDYANLLNAVERPNPVLEIQCPSSFENVSVPGLMFGIHWSTTGTVIQKIEQARAELAAEIGGAREQLDELSSGIEMNVTLIQREFLKQFARDQRMIETQCPNVFTIVPVKGRLWHRVTGERVQMRLYCQAPGVWHAPADGGRYEFTLEAGWLRATLPYIVALIKVLKLAVPLAGAVLELVDTTGAEERDAEISLMSQLVETLPSDLAISIEDAALVEARQLEGAPLRSLRRLLDTLDPSRQWGGLRPVLTPEGHLLWLCEEHTRPYIV